MIIDIVFLPAGKGKGMKIQPWPKVYCINASKLCFDVLDLLLNCSLLYYMTLVIGLWGRTNVLKLLVSGRENFLQAIKII